MKNRAGSRQFIDKIGVIRPWSNNTRDGCYWLPDVKDTVQIKGHRGFSRVVIGNARKAYNNRNV